MNSKKLIGLFLCSTLVLTFACKEDSKKVIKTEPISFTKEGELSIYKAETDTVISTFDIEIAESEYETQTGLMYREAMEPQQGMLFIFQDVAMHSFYMKNTKIALDLIFIDENLKIVSFQEKAKPLDESGLSSKVPVQYVLEVNAGIVQSMGLSVGDSIAYQKQ